MTFGQGVANYARDEEATAQAVKTRLLLLFNEWFLDTSAGVPYLQQIMVKPPNLPLAEAIMKRTILLTEGVAEIRSFGMTFDRETRRLGIQATVVNIYGTVSNIKVTQ
ncbi:MAG: hypothetical protein ACYC0P_06960 [Thiobacillus sp.]